MNFDQRVQQIISAVTPANTTNGPGETHLVRVPNDVIRQAPEMVAPIIIGALPENALIASVEALTGHDETVFRVTTAVQATNLAEKADQIQKVLDLIRAECVEDSGATRTITLPMTDDLILRLPAARVAELIRSDTKNRPIVGIDAECWFGMGGTQGPESCTIFKVRVG